MSRPISRRDAITLLTLAIAAGACSAGPRALVPGEDSCAHCRMTIDDTRFGALVLTARGRLQAFDSIECLAAYVSLLGPQEQPRGLWVANFDQPAQWLDPARAMFLQGSALRSPMGRDLAAFAPGNDQGALERFGGALMRWPEVVALAATPLRREHGAHGAARPVRTTRTRHTTGPSRGRPHA
jgi:copper chaperone NosL